MSKEKFNQLMNQFSSEAEQQRLDEERAARRWKTWCAFGRGFSWVVLALGLAAGYAFRDDIGRASHQLMSRPEPPGAEQQAKVRQMFQQVEKHNAAVEDAGK